MKIALGLLISLFAVNIQAAEKGKPAKEGNFQTTMDFDSSMIDGKMKAPSGFFLQGRNRQSLSNMVKLRSNFSGKLRDSEAAVKALVK
jgi:hypothetical protein